MYRPLCLDGIEWVYKDFRLGVSTTALDVTVEGEDGGSEFGDSWDFTTTSNNWSYNHTHSLQVGSFKGLSYTTPFEGPSYWGPLRRLLAVMRFRLGVWPTLSLSEGSQQNMGGYCLRGLTPPDTQAT